MNETTPSAASTAVREAGRPVAAGVRHWTTRLIAWVVTSVAVLISTFAASVAPAGAATVGGVDVVASASFNSCAQTVSVLPMSLENVGSNYSVYAMGSVWEQGRGWVSSGWYRVDGITTIQFYRVDHEPYGYVYMSYARLVNGAWVYAGEYTAITDDLDNGFCPVS